MKLYLSLGSNIGARRTNIITALGMLDARYGRRLAQSEIIETSALGFDGPDFLNCVACFETGEDPLEILNYCKRSEKSLGRKDHPVYNTVGERIYMNRTIDIDILIYGDLKMDTPELKIPHHQVESRPFVKPLLEQVGYVVEK